MATEAKTNESCVEPSTAAVNVALLAFAADRRAAVRRAACAAVDRSPTQQQTRRTLLQRLIDATDWLTDGHRTVIHVQTLPYTLRAASRTVPVSRNWQTKPWFTAPAADHHQRAQITLHLREKVSWLSRHALSQLSTRTRPHCLIYLLRLSPRNWACIHLFSRDIHEVTRPTGWARTRCILDKWPLQKQRHISCFLSTENKQQSVWVVICVVSVRDSGNQKAKHSKQS